MVPGGFLIKVGRERGQKKDEKEGKERKKKKSA